MKNLFFLLIASMLLITIACDKNKDCDAGQLSTNIVGEWNITFAGVAIAQVEFRANGDLIDPLGLLVPDLIGGVVVDEKTYVVQSNTLIRLTGSNSMGSVNYDVDVSSYDCDEVVVDVQGTEYTLKRRD